MRGDLEGCVWMGGKWKWKGGEKEQDAAGKAALWCVERDVESPESITRGHC